MSQWGEAPLIAACALRDLKKGTKGVMLDALMGWAQANPPSRTSVRAKVEPVRQAAGVSGCMVTCRENDAGQAQYKSSYLYMYLKHAVITEEMQLDVHHEFKRTPACMTGVGRLIDQLSRAFSAHSVSIMRMPHDCSYHNMCSLSHASQLHTCIRYTYTWRHVHSLIFVDDFHPIEGRC